MAQVFEWEAPLYHQTQKKSGWYTNIILGAIVLFGIAWYVENILFGVFILLAAGAFVILGRSEPSIAKFRVDERGAIVNSTLYPYDSLESYWIEKNTLYIKRDNALSLHLFLPLGDINKEELEEAIKEHLPKEEYQETLIDTIAEYINF